MHRDELGSDTHAGTKAVLTAKGIPFTKRAATLMKLDDYENSDYVIGMDSYNIRDLMRLTHNDPERKISLLLSFAGEERDIADPWYTGNFENTYNDVSKGCNALLGKIKKELGR